MYRKQAPSKGGYHLKNRGTSEEKDPARTYPHQRPQELLEDECTLRIVTGLV